MFLLVWRDPDPRSHWSVRCPLQNSLELWVEIPPTGYFYPQKEKNRDRGISSRSRMAACGRILLFLLWRGAVLHWAGSAERTTKKLTRVGSCPNRPMPQRLSGSFTLAASTLDRLRTVDRDGYNAVVYRSVDHLAFTCCDIMLPVA